MRRFLALVFAALLVHACGGGKSSPAPQTPVTPTPPVQQNRAPIVNSVTVNPTVGIQDRTQFLFNVSASDADGDALSYAWSIAGNTASGQSPAMTFVSGGSGTATVTVTDGKGASATGNVAFQVNTMAGTWSGTGPWGNCTMTLTQTAGFIVGSYTDALGTAQVGPTGELGTIDNNGNISLRVKQAPYADFTMKGVLEGNGRRITGTVTGSGVSGEPFVMMK